MNAPILSSWKRARTVVVAVAALVMTVVFGLPGPAPGARAQVPPSVRSICFPVVEPVHFVDSFGAPRSGGRRHEGTDLMGEKGSRLVSPVDGVIVDLRGPGEAYSDHSLRILDDDGWFYAFLHMNDDTPGTDDGAAGFEQVFAPGLVEGVRVRAGQFVGFMGDSGNAEGSGPHLHFEIRQPAADLWASVAINSYPALIAATRCADPTAVPPGPPVVRATIPTAAPSAR
ncbi:MAG: M23 family metallopeptidase [Acidimicrobiales bacterium]